MGGWTEKGYRNRARSKKTKTQTKSSKYIREARERHNKEITKREY
jgi:hypothetical protein